MNYNAISYVVKHNDYVEAFNCNGNILYTYDDSCCHDLLEYDEKGRIIHSAIIENDSVYIKEIFKYDDNDNMIYHNFVGRYTEYITYNNNNEPISTVIEYHNGYIVRLIEFKNGGYMMVGSDLSFIVVEYDESDNMIVRKKIY